MQATGDENRNRFDRWCRERGLTDKAVAERLGCTQQAVNLWRKPFGDPKRVPPSWTWLLKIHELTGGLVLPNDFLDPRERRSRCADRADAVAEDVQ